MWLALKASAARKRTKAATVAKITAILSASPGRSEFLSLTRAVLAQNHTDSNTRMALIADRPSASFVRPNMMAPAVSGQNLNMARHSGCGSP